MKKQHVMLLGVMVALAVGAAGCEEVGSATDATGEVVSSEVVTTVEAVTTTVVPTGPPSYWSTPRPAVSPPALEGHRLVYDPVTSKVYLFGGYAPEYPKDHIPGGIWAYDSGANTWAQLSPTGGPVGKIRSAVYVPTTKKTFCLSSTSGGGGMGDSELYAYDATTNAWTKLDSSGDIPEAGGVLVYDPSMGKVLDFRGGTVFAYDPATNAWDQLQAVGGAAGVSSAVYDPNTGKVFVWGGLSLLAYDPGTNTFSPVAMPKMSPQGRYGPEMVYHPGCKLIILFGGGSDDPNYPENLWGYDTVNDSWQLIKPSARAPYGRANTAMVYDAESADIIMFGGRNDDHGQVIERMGDGIGEGWMEIMPFSDMWLLSTEGAGQ